MNGSLAKTRPAEAVAQSGDQLCSALRDKIERLKESAEVAPAALLDEVLSLAAEAERRMAEQRRRNAYLESVAVSDELTELLNRRGLFDHMNRMLAMADRHGHGAGDAVLRRVAEILAANTRAADVVARVGGDQFVALLVRSG